MSFCCRRGASAAGGIISLSTEEISKGVKACRYGRGSSTLIGSWNGGNSIGICDTGGAGRGGR